MLIVTAKIPRRRLAVSGAAAAVLCCIILIASLIPSSERQAEVFASPSTKGVRTAEDRASYLEHFGWKVSPEPSSVEELKIPEEFDDRYREYLELQASQGFDLSKYAGKRVKRYTYSIENYPTGETGIVANLLIYKNTVIGGEVLSPTMNGFLHGLAMPQIQTEKQESDTQTPVSELS